MIVLYASSKKYYSQPYSVINNATDIL